MCVYEITSRFSFSYVFTKAYDGHMNLILSDAEETIMIVDTDNAPNGQTTVNVRVTDSRSSLHAHSNLGCETKTGHVVR
jgi:hypothetical protein